MDRTDHRSMLSASETLFGMYDEEEEETGAKS